MVAARLRRRAAAAPRAQNFATSGFHFIEASVTIAPAHGWALAAALAAVTERKIGCSAGWATLPRRVLAGHHSAITRPKSGGCVSRSHEALAARNVALPRGRVSRARPPER